jgi:hypothetical protein
LREPIERYATFSEDVIGVVGPRWRQMSGIKLLNPLLGLPKLQSDAMPAILTGDEEHEVR